MARLPEPTEVLRLGLLTLPDVVGIAGDRIGTRLQGDEAGLQLAGLGGPAGYGQAEPLVQVACWGPDLGGGTDDGTAWRLAAAVTDDRAGVESLRGAYDGGWLAGVGIEVHPYWSADPDTDRPRYLLTVRLHTTTHEE